MADDVILKPQFSSSSKDITRNQRNLDFKQYMMLFGTQYVIKKLINANVQTLLYQMPAGKIFCITSVQQSMLMLSTTNQVTYTYILNDPTNMCIHMLQAALSGTNAAGTVNFDPPIILKTANATVHYGVESAQVKGTVCLVGYELDSQIFTDFQTKTFNDFFS